MVMCKFGIVLQLAGINFTKFSKFAKKLNSHKNFTFHRI